MKNNMGKAIVISVTGKDPEEEHDEMQADMVTSADPKDGHVHAVPEFAIDDQGNGSTAPAGDPIHVHAIVDHEVIDSVHGEYVSEHAGIEDSTNDEQDEKESQ